MASDLETASSKTGEDLLEFWEDPNNADLIKNAVCLESLEYKDLIRDHFEGIKDEDIDKILEEYRRSVEEMNGDGAGREEGGVGRDDGITATGSDEDGSGGQEGGAGREEGGAGREEGGAGREEGGAGREEGGAERDEGGAGREEGGAGRGEGITATGGDAGGAGSGDGGKKFYKFVNDDNLVKRPYCSVGKLFWVRNETDIIYWATAFYIGLRTIISVAHAFDWPRGLYNRIVSFYTGQTRRDPRQAFFVPAMEDKDDIQGKRYGYYKIEDLKILESYRPRRFYQTLISPCFDICSAKLCWGVKEGQLLEPVDTLLIPMKCCHG